MNSQASLKEKLETLSQRLTENRAFLQSYMLDPNPDNRPAEEERIKDILAVAGEMENILGELIEKKTTYDSQPNPVDSDFNLEYKTHVLGLPDGEDNIDGDWDMTEEEMGGIDDPEILSEKIIAKKLKKSKKHKKDKKGKKNKKNK
ncbi:MAG TPA: hypothetical protein DDY92_06405 [Dialister sp.]|nr:hypothetical protein [Dialister sp.]